MYEVGGHAKKAAKANGNRAAKRRPVGVGEARKKPSTQVMDSLFLGEMRVTHMKDSKELPLHFYYIPTF